MNWKRGIIILLVTFTAGWMLFDGSRALIIGDYVTPQTGEYAGQLGPWANLVEAIGIEPRSTMMKAIFVLYGLSGIVAVIAYALKKGWARSALIILAILGLWYVPIGTITNVITLLLLLTTGG